MIRKSLALLFATAIGVVCVGLAPLSAQGAREGITVHGHWVLEVRNPDGTLVTRREFENGLNETRGHGAEWLGMLLKRTSTAGRWRVILASLNGSGPWGNGSMGQIHEAGFPVTGNTSDTLKFDPGNTLVLRGSLEALQAGTVTHVFTSNYSSLNHMTPKDCGNLLDVSGLSPTAFTETAVRNASGNPTPLPLELGQIV